jgi:hypothetical protein
MLFYVRRQTGADGSFEWYVLNGHTRRRASGGCCRAGEIAGEARPSQSESAQASAGRPIGEDPRRRRVLHGIGFPTINRLALPDHAPFY